MTANNSFRKIYHISHKIISKRNDSSLGILPCLNLCANETTFLQILEIDSIALKNIYIFLNQFVSQFQGKSLSRNQGTYTYQSNQTYKQLCAS